jgi:hypothetical protein
MNIKTNEESPCQNIEDAADLTSPLSSVEQEDQNSLADLDAVLAQLKDNKDTEQSPLDTKQNKRKSKPSKA